MRALLWVVALMTASALAGAAIIMVLALGFYTGYALTLAVVTGLIVSIPVSWAVTRAIGKSDPHWSVRRDEKV
ncbi:hypothetical protein HCZ30_07670 [Marivivens donghaensis]|uniref:CTP synthetase n=1 Tax=Marivivens donghaensis TaxID=1699413 RepID=A0ABX0W0C2_9RHOB|nr:hypothetical protein [Marivivens donghaensis]NIY72313.1 hypothetical protein [Marivivens donghaensis]